MNNIQSENILTVNNKEIYNLYLKDIRKYKKPLTKLEEKKYFTKLRNGNKSMFDLILKHNLLFVITIAKKYQHSIGNSSLTLEDLIAEGNVGLCIAIERFDHTSDNKFISYAVFWIKQQILLSIKNNIKNIRTTQNNQARLFKLNALETRLQQTLNIDIDINTLHEHALKENIITPAHDTLYIENLKISSYFEKSLFEKIDDENNNELIDLYINNNIVQEDDKLSIEELNNNINNILNKIKHPNAIRMIKDLYGINDLSYPLSMVEIAEKYGYTEPGTRHIIKKYMSHLKITYKNKKHLYL